MCVIHLHEQTYTHKQTIVICLHEIKNPKTKGNSC